MFKKRHISDIIFDVINISLLLLFTFACLYPFLYVLFASISSPSEFAYFQGFLMWPQGFSTLAYEVVFRNPNVYIGYANTIFYTVVGTVSSIAFTTLAAYVLSRKRFMLKKFFMIMIVVTMYLNGGLIANFLLIKNIGLYDSRAAIILPALIATWNMIILRTSFARIPEALEEAAYIDGANEFTTMVKVVVPCSMATIAVIMLFYAVGYWNSWFTASIYLRDTDKMPLQIFLRQILIENEDAGNSMTDFLDDVEYTFLSETVKHATTMVAILPIICVYPFVQKYFVKGVMLGSIKE